jgi:hypothetical protein
MEDEAKKMLEQAALFPHMLKQWLQAAQLLMTHIKMQQRTGSSSQSVLTHPNLNRQAP